jgi:putative hydrolase of the HAD superfamily
MSAADSRRAPAVRAVIFDIGRVIVRINISRSFASFGTPLGLSAHEVLSAIENDPLWKDWQEGRVSPHAWHQHIANRFHSPLDFDGFCETWARALEPETILKDDLFVQLARRARLALLSNTDPIHVARMERDFSFLRHFPVRVYSCTIGAVKPSPKIYRHALSELGVTPQESLYIDDIPAFVEAARQIGMRGFHFTGPDSLDAELAGLGLLTE